MQKNAPEGLIKVERIAFGPGSYAAIEIRFAGADPAVLRDLGAGAVRVLKETSPNALVPRLDWAEQELVMQPVYAEDRAQVAGISRSDITKALQYENEDRMTGVYREGDRQLPIVLRNARDEDANFSDVLVYSDSGGAFVPLAQVTESFSFEV